MLPRTPASAFFGVMLIFVISLGFVCTVSNADDAYSLVFPDEEEFFAPPGPICTYDGISAACGQLLIKFRSFKNPAAVKQVLRILDDYKAMRIGQMPSVGMIQVSVPDKQVIKLREDLKNTGVVLVTFAVDSTFQSGEKGTSEKTWD